jgi:hypothetical protein
MLSEKTQKVLRRRGQLIEIIFEAFTKVNPLKISEKLFVTYFTPCNRFLRILYETTKDDTTLSPDIVAEIVVRAFPVRDVASNIITEQQICTIAKDISQRIINDSGRLREDLPTSRF